MKIQCISLTRLYCKNATDKNNAALLDKERERERELSINGIQTWPILLRFIPTRCFGERRPPTDHHTFISLHMQYIQTYPHILANPCVVTEPCLLLIISPFMSLCMHNRTPTRRCFSIGRSSLTTHTK